MLDLKTMAARVAYVQKPVLKMAWGIVDREGGYVNDPEDNGGPTNHGVSLKYALDQGLVFDLNGDGKVDEEDIKLITEAQAVAVFLWDFFMRVGLVTVPECVQENCFDQSVNGGGGSAVSILQTTINNLRQVSPALQKLFAPLVVDGALGGKSNLAAHQTADVVGDLVFNNAYCDARKANYEAIVRNNPDQSVYLKGWLARAESFRRVK